MVRDMDLVRAILAEIEKRELVTFEIEIEGYKENEIAYHLDILIESGLVKGEVVLVASGERRIITIDRLTWEGHEFLDAARNSSVWESAKQTMKTEGIQLPFDVLKDLLKASLRSMVLPE